MVWTTEDCVKIGLGWLSPHPCPISHTFQPYPQSMFTISQIMLEAEAVSNPPGLPPASPPLFPVGHPDLSFPAFPEFQH